MPSLGVLNPRFFFGRPFSSASTGVLYNVSVTRLIRARFGRAEIGAYIRFTV